MAITKNTEIKIEVSLDKNNIPEYMNWTAEDGGISRQETKAMLLSFWNSEAHGGQSDRRDIATAPSDVSERSSGGLHRDAGESGYSVS